MSPAVPAALSREQPRDDGSPPVVLVLDRGRAARRQVEGWARSEHPGATVLGAAQRDGIELLDAERLVIPVRVSRRVARLRAGSAPGAGEVVAGEPDTVARLRARHGDRATGFAASVVRAAEIACDRAERKLVGDRYKVPRRVTEQITSSERFQGAVAELAGSLGRAAEDVLTEAAGCVRELVAVQTPAAIDAYLRVLSPMHARAWTAQVDPADIERLRELGRDRALVFLPAHRSYVDPLVLGQALHRQDMPLNHVLGGNNMAIWPIGPLGRRAGVVFIRRSNAGDRIYKLALREYIGHLVATRFNLEWYLEGGRSRTGKLRPPKVGLLAYLARALADGRAPDVALVPVSIVYDQMHEVGALAAEQGGARKSGEGVRWLARYVRGQLRDAGNAWIRFGDPFSLREAMAEAGEGRAQLNKVAFRICDGINRATPVTSTALVTLALLGTRDRALTAGQTGRVVEPLLDHLAVRGLPAVGADLRSGPGLRETLDQLVAARVATRFDGGSEPVWSVSPGQHRVAAFYRNTAVHHFLNRAVAELVLLGPAGDGHAGSGVEDVWSDAMALRELLEFEFFFPAKPLFREEIAAELALLDPAWERPGRGVEESLARTGLLVAPRVLRSFLDAQLVVGRVLAELPAGAVDRDAVLGTCLGTGQQMLLQGSLHRADSVSRELYASALKLAEHRGLTAADPERARAARLRFVAEVRGVLDRLDRLGALEQELVDGALR